MPVLLPALGLLALGVVIMVVLAKTRPGSGTSVEMDAETHLRRSRAVAFAAGIVTVIVCGVAVGSLGRGITIAPAAAGAVMMCLLAVGERTVPLGAAPARRASLEPRPLSRSVERSVTIVLLAALAALAAIFVLGWSTANADDAGRAGRAVEWGTRLGSQSQTPWPGSFYSAPTATCLLVAALTFAVAIREVTYRPQLNPDASAAVNDRAMRERSAHILHAVGLVAVGSTLAGFAFMVLFATSHASSGSPTWVEVAHWCALGGVLLAAGALLLGAREAVRR